MKAETRDAGRLAGGAGVVAATFAALCCAGAPIIVSILAATGLSFLRRDAILLPVIAIALAVALWGFWRGRRTHHSSGPFTLGLMGSFALVAGVVPLHGPIAKLFLGVGALALLGSAVWNARCGTDSAARRVEPSSPPNEARESVPRATPRRR